MKIPENDPWCIYMKLQPAIEWWHVPKHDVLAQKDRVSFYQEPINDISSKERSFHRFWKLQVVITAGFP